MAMNCKGLCSYHPNIFINMRPSFKIGENVYFCKLCEKYIEIKQVIKNALFKFKNKCICCKAKFRVKCSKHGRQNRHYCKCGCGEKIHKMDNRGRKRLYLIGHNRKIKDLSERTCNKCNKKTKAFNQYGRPKWKKQQIDNNTIVYLCHYCYNKNRYRIKQLKKILSELHYSAIMKMI